MSIVDDNGKHQ